MAKYELLPTIKITANDAILPSHELPELVRLSDPAVSVMTDFSHVPALTISPDKSMDDALNEMKVTGTHLLLVMDDEDHLLGVVGSEDLLGEKPIKIIQERRILRENVLVNMLMVPTNDITAFIMDTIEIAKVGNIVKTLTQSKQYYALALSYCDNVKKPLIRGIFTTSQISKQLHMDLDSALSK